MTETLPELLARAERDGWSAGLAYHVAHMFSRSEKPDEMLVCVLCGWYWAGLNRCLNPDCRGFSTWGHHKGADPDSWVRVPGGWRPRMPGERR